MEEATNFIYSDSLSLTQMIVAIMLYLVSPLKIRASMMAPLLKKKRSLRSADYAHWDEQNRFDKETSADPRISGPFCAGFHR